MFHKQAIELKRKLASGRPSPGLWMNLPSITAAEVVAGAGYDWIVADAEHGPFYLDALYQALTAFRGSSVVPLVRVPWNDHVRIKQVLDMGWAGVVIPQVNTEENARHAVAACRYPPQGSRGYGPVRAGNHGWSEKEYVAAANEAVFCIIQIENVPAAEENIDKMVRIAGIDGIWVGRNDMSGSIGSFLDSDNPKIWSAVQRIFESAKSAGIPTGNALDGVETIDRALEMGCQWISLGKDLDFLREAARHSLDAFRSALTSSKD